MNRTRAAADTTGIDRLLERQHRRIRRRFVFHGLGYVCGGLASFGLTYYLIDRAFHLPAPVRLVLSAAIAWFLFLVVRRRLLYPLSRAFGRVDVALVIERNFPHLHQKLVSALQLRPLLERDEGDLRNQSAAMIRKVVAAAEAEATEIPADRILNPAGTFRVWGLASCALLIAGSGIIADPTSTGVFLQRVFGLDVPYPRATHLHVELPPSGRALKVERDGNRATVTLAARSDLHVSVRAEGEEPRAVFLDVSAAGGDRAVPMVHRGQGRFKTVFRRIQEPFTFYARGGDDFHGDLLVEVRTIQPPMVTAIETVLTAPAYTGRLPETVASGTIEALVGTAVEVRIEASEAVTEAALAFQESERRITLQQANVPAASGSGTRTVYRGRFTVQESDRYQVELLGASGLTNPETGYYLVIAMPDFPPVARLLQPDGGEVNSLLPNGILPVRLEYRDDYGIQQARMVVQTARDDEVAARRLVTAVDGAPPPSNGISTWLFPLQELVSLTSEGDAPAQQGTIGIGITITDNRSPDPQTTTLPARPLQIVNQVQLGAGVHRLFRKIREEIDAAESLQADRIERLQDLIETAGDLGPVQRATRLTAIEVGQNRIASYTGHGHRGLLRAFDLHLFNRYEEDNVTAKLLDTWLHWHRAHPSPVAHPPEFYREIARGRADGSLPAMPRALDPILIMAETADGIANARSPRCLRALAEAQVAENLPAWSAHARDALDHQKAILVDLKGLLERLREWNDFQDVVQETRALRDQQREVHNRTVLLQEKKR